DLVVVADRVVGLLNGVLGVLLQQVGVEDPLLGLGVDLEVQRERVPDRGELLLPLGVVEPGEPPPERGVVIQDERGDVVHTALFTWAGGFQTGSRSYPRLVSFDSRVWQTCSRTATRA